MGAYNAGSYRSAIMALWIAVVADVIDKVKDMADEGDAAAKLLRDSIHKAAAQGDKLMMQRIENALLDDARDKLQLISAEDHRDLSRLKEDRNLCAHPAFVSEDELFNPTPERVRDHLASAVDALLSHGPVRGRRLLDRFDSQVRSRSLPSDDEKLLATIREGFVENSTPQLKSSLCAVSIKATLDEANDDKVRWQYSRVARALWWLIPAEFEQSLKSILDKRQDGLDDDGVMLLVEGLCYVEPTWRNLRDGTRHRIESFIATTSIGELVVPRALFAPLPFPPVDGYLIERVADVQDDPVVVDHFTDQLEVEPDRRLISHFVNRLRRALYYTEAEFWMKGLVALAAAFTADDLRSVLEAYRSNDQAYDSVLARKQLKILEWRTNLPESAMAGIWSRYHDELKAERAAERADLEKLEE